jgi:hypothetical protein
MLWELSCLVKVRLTDMLAMPFPLLCWCQRLCASILAQDEAKWTVACAVLDLLMAAERLCEVAVGMLRTSIHEFKGDCRLT